MSHLSESMYSEVAHLIESSQWGSLCTTTLSATDDGDYEYTDYSTSGELTTSHTFSPEVQEKLHAGVDKLSELYTVVNPSHEVSTFIEWVLQADSVYAKAYITNTTPTDSELFNELAAEVVENTDIEPERVTRIDAVDAPFSSVSNDVTVDFENPTPHENLVNYDTLDEYIEARLERDSSLDEDELRDKEYYEDYFNLQGEIRTKICEKAAASWSRDVHVTQPAEIKPTHARLKRNGNTVSEFTVFASLSSLLD